MSEPPEWKGPVDVSFVMACHNAGEFLESAVKSALDQRDVIVEVLIVDDGSSDGSLEHAQELARGDGRVRVFRTPANSGPAGARNIGIRQMRGTWYAILDSDDLIDSGRSRALLTIADQSGADMVADNLIEFGDGMQERDMYDFGVNEGWRFLELEEYLNRSRLFGKLPSPGFLKPMIRKATIDRYGLSYDTDLRIGEDDELIVHALAEGCRYAVTDRAMYRYRKHSASISHRLSLDNVDKMVAAEARIRQRIGPAAQKSPAYRGRQRALERGHAFVQSIERLKARDLAGAVAAILREPGAIFLYRMPLTALFERMTAT